MRSLEAHRTVRVQEGAAGRAPPRVKAARLVVRGLLRLLFRVRVWAAAAGRGGPLAGRGTGARRRA
jgi:hypothetical protein